MLNNILLCSICAVVLTGTTYPLFAELLFGAKLSVGPPYFERTVFPLAIPLFAGDVARAGAAVEARGPVAGAAEAVVGGADRGADRHRRRGRAARRLRRAGLRRLGLADLRRLRRTGRAHPAVPHAPSPPFARASAAQPLSVWGSAVAHAGMGVTVAGIAGMSLAVSTIVAVHPGQTRAARRL